MGDRVALVELAMAWLGKRPYGGLAIFVGDDYLTAVPAPAHGGTLSTAEEDRVGAGGDMIHNFPLLISSLLPTLMLKYPRNFTKGE